MYCKPVSVVYNKCGLFNVGTERENKNNLMKSMAFQVQW